MKYAKACLVMMGFLLALPVFAQRQSGCAKDDLGRVFCAPSGGTAVPSMNGIVCAPGQCLQDDLGYLKCSREMSGGAVRDDLGRIVCVGGCVNPSKEFCKKMGE